MNNFCNLNGGAYIKDEYKNIEEGFDKVQSALRQKWTSAELGIRPLWCTNNSPNVSDIPAEWNFSCFFGMKIQFEGYENEYEINATYLSENDMQLSTPFLGISGSYNFTIYGGNVADNELNLLQRWTNVELGAGAADIGVNTIADVVGLDIAFALGKKIRVDGYDTLHLIQSFDSGDYYITPAFTGTPGTYNFILYGDNVVKKFNDIENEINIAVQKKGTTKAITFNPDGTVQTIIYRDAGDNLVRQDIYTYSTNLITEYINCGGIITTYFYHLDTLITEVV